MPWIIGCCRVPLLLYGLDVGLSLCFVASSSFLRATSPIRKLQRQASIYQRAHITKQTSVMGASPPEGDSVLLQQEVMSSLPGTESEQDSGSHSNAFKRGFIIFVDSLNTNSKFLFWTTTCPDISFENVEKRLCYFRSTFSKRYFTITCRPKGGTVNLRCCIFSQNENGTNPWQHQVIQWLRPGAVYQRLKFSFWDEEKWGHQISWR